MSLTILDGTPSVDHRWIRRAKPLALFWEGCVVLLTLLALMIYAVLPFALNDIEASTRSATRAALDAQAYPWVDIAVSGQDVQLSGVQPTPQAGARAVSIARAVDCPTWAGRIRCVINISGHFTNPDQGFPIAPAKPAH